MNWLKIFYHLLCATTISVILLIITILNGCVTTKHTFNSVITQY